MPTISLTLPTAGTEITAGLHSSNYSELQTLLNGGLDADNLEDGAVTTAKLAAGAVTSAKIGVTTSSYTPAWSSSGTQPSLGNGSVNGRYIQVGKLIFAYMSLTAGSTSTFGTGSYYLSLPVQAASTAMLWIGHGRLVDSGTATYKLTVYPGSSAGTVGIVVEVVSGSTITFNGVSATSPFTMTNGDFFELAVVYEAA
jgi:hypothetical protein